MRLRLIWTNAGETIMLDGDSAACFFTWPELQPEFKRPSENKTHVSSENVPILWCFTLNLCAFNHALYTLLNTK